ncbi:synaptotagmin-5-like [Anguilla anguilla]|uniref:synaptotagmin-5-like n=1 Tax=Anguilla anguilla TaxID=7936 RepID=UPI0015AECCA7|nr:synaptotagmin-5-like [Anguilla anguilla]
MPYRDEEYPGQPLWQSVLFFCCKGMIEGITILLFAWLLVQVLFSKHLEVHLQVLLGVGLAVFCFCLILGCVLCWRRGKPRPPEDKEAAMSLPPLPADHVNLALSGSSPLAVTVPVKQQYEELEGDVLEYPSPYGCSSPSPSPPPSPSEDDFAALPSSPRPRAASELNEHPKSHFPLRRLSTPAGSSYKPAVHGRASLPSLPKLGLVSKTRRALERRCTVTGDSFLDGERSRLQPSPAPEGSPSALRYGSGSCRKPPLRLHFTLLFSPARGTLTVAVLGLLGASRRLGGVFVRASLPPLCPAPLQSAARRRSLSPEFQSQTFVLQVGSVEQLRGCALQLAVFARDFSGLREAPLGDLELPCGEIDWEPDYAIAFTKELRPAKYKLRKSLSSVDALSRKEPVCVPRVLGQLFVLLQYQTLAHRIKVMVRKAENLAKLTRMPGAPDHYVVINLRKKGVVIGTKETKGAGGYNAVWNAPFLFDLPPGDVNQLPLVLEFIVMQGRIYKKGSVLGRVLIGREAPETGQTHWKDMCSRGQVETARWHAIQPDSP